MKKLQKLRDFVVTAITMTLFAVAMAVITVEWMAGCGESYTDAYGKIHINQCVFINFPPKEST